MTKNSKNTQKNISADEGPSLQKIFFGTSGLSLVYKHEGGGEGLPGLLPWIRHISWIKYISSDDNCYLMNLKSVGTFPVILGSVSNDNSDDNESRKKSNRFRLAKKSNLHVHHAFLYISLPLLHDCEVKLPNFTFYEGREQEKTI